ncbi:MAG: hypothetical protein PHX49_02825 [Bacteroidales bacterium]|nr:hypothetical protein [Bacteroidales bacterium]
MKHLKLLSTIGFVLLTVMSATAQTSPEQEVIAYMVKSTVFPEPSIRFLERLDKEIKENPGDTAKINQRKRFLDFESSEKNIHPIILITETSLGYYAKDSLLVEKLKKLPSFDMEAYNDLFEKNKESIVISPIEKMDTNVIYMTHKERDMIFKGDFYEGWNNYHKQYGYKSTVGFSRPGFNATKDKAIICYASTSGSRYSAAYFITLEKVYGKWIKKESYLYFQS